MVIRILEDDGISKLVRVCADDDSEFYTLRTKLQPIGAEGEYGLVTIARAKTMRAAFARAEKRQKIAKANQELETVECSTD
jgi:hypothetical protein